MRIQSLPVLAALAISPLTAQATTIGFEDLGYTYPRMLYGTSMTDDGFTFSGSNFSLVNGNAYPTAAAGSYYIENGTSASFAPVTMTATNGSAFSFDDFFIEAFNQGNNDISAITVTGYLNGVKVGNTIAFTDTTSWQDIYANFADVTSVVITGGYEALDNITVNDPTDVPEPATLALFGTGLLCLGAIYRRRSGASPAI